MVINTPAVPFPGDERVEGAGVHDGLRELRGVLRHLPVESKTRRRAAKCLTQNPCRTQRVCRYVRPLPPTHKDAFCLQVHSFLMGCGRPRHRAQDERSGLLVEPVLLRQRVDELRQDLVRHDGLRELVGVVRQAAERQRGALLDRPGRPHSGEGQNSGVGCERPRTARRCFKPVLRISGTQNGTSDSARAG